MTIAAAALVLGPTAVAVIGQVSIWLISGCKPNPYALGECLVGSYNLAFALMVATLGGTYVAVLALPASFLLLLAAVWLSRRRAAKNN
ncbi:hypothetical protein [Variovorax paradoxus]|uniref:hypothetical protein n=1 Tax=Variovorax paradoxus TaxID=34073 RepID=UPI002480F861|nr:hypothetical protein [Variovorax paradoxus]WGT61988.1 hypothetical protein QHG62_18205 [Variovorax paradoxus]